MRSVPSPLHGTSHRIRSKRSRLRLPSFPLALAPLLLALEPSFSSLDDDSCIGAAVEFEAGAGAELLFAPAAALDDDDEDAEDDEAESFATKMFGKN